MKKSILLVCTALAITSLPVHASEKATSNKPWILPVVVAGASGSAAFVSYVLHTKGRKKHDQLVNANHWLYSMLHGTAKHTLEKSCEMTKSTYPALTASVNELAVIYGRDNDPLSTKTENEIQNYVRSKRPSDTLSRITSLGTQLFVVGAISGCIQYYKNRR